MCYCIELLDMYDDGYQSFLTALLVHVLDTVQLVANQQSITYNFLCELFRLMTHQTPLISAGKRLLWLWLAMVICINAGVARFVCITRLHIH